MWKQMLQEKKSLNLDDNLFNLDNKIKKLDEKFEQQQKRIMTFRQSKISLKEKIEKIKTEYSSSREQYKSLYAVNVKLREQIQRYRSLLSHGEKNYHADSLTENQKKRRKVDASPLDRITLKLTYDEDIFNNSNKVEGIITVTNNSLETVSLQSWSLRSKQTGKIFPFSDNTIIGSTMELIVYVGNKKNFFPEKHHYLWVNEDNLYTDEIELVNASNTVVWSEKYEIKMEHDC